jgi:hypothetical protein
MLRHRFLQFKLITLKNTTNTTNLKNSNIPDNFSEVKVIILGYKDK